MIICNEKLNSLSLEIWEWIKDGKSIDNAPDDIKEKVREYRELSEKLENEELRMMGCNV